MKKELDDRRFEDTLLVNQNDELQDDEAPVQEIEEEPESVANLAPCEQHLESQIVENSELPEQEFSFHE